LAKTFLCRAIKYQRRGFRPQTLLTSLVDAKAYPRDEIVALYHERWELELGYDELKTDMLAREEAIRSRSPRSVAAAGAITRTGSYTSGGRLRSLRCSERRWRPR
jgi:hypothetical protein